METETKRISGLTIACDHCPNRAAYRSESPSSTGVAVHWTCDTHKAGA